MMRFLQLTIFCGLTLLMLSGKALAGEPFPHIQLPKGLPKAQDHCVAPLADIRRNHMKYLLHHRDLTVHEGIRTTKYSLAKCIDCHVQPNAQGKFYGPHSKKFFCNACHQYAAVHIDCFDCHANRPQKYIKRDATKEASTDKKTGKALADNTSNGGSKK